LREVPVIPAILFMVGLWLLTFATDAVDLALEWRFPGARR
jgi:hypothetical protein